MTQLTTSTPLPALCRGRSFARYWVQALSSDGRMAYVTPRYGVPLGDAMVLSVNELTPIPDEEESAIAKERADNVRMSYGAPRPHL